MDFDREMQEIKSEPLSRENTETIKSKGREEKYSNFGEAKNSRVIQEGESGRLGI